MNFINQYLLANSGTMVVKPYLIWSALFSLSVAAGRKVLTDMEHYTLRPIFYVLLIGDSGMRKSMPKNQALRMLKAAKLEVPVGPGSGSVSAITKLLCSEKCLRTYVDHEGVLQELRQIILPIDELKLFLGQVDPEGQCDWMTGIYDCDEFPYLTHKHGDLNVINPCVNILACAQPEWFPTYFRKGYFSSGFARRCNMVYVTDEPPKIAFPRKTVQARDAELWCIAHLQKLHKLAGTFTWTPEARTVHERWFGNLPAQSNMLLKAIYENKDCMVIRVSMLLGLAEPEPRFVHTEQSIQTAIALLDALEETLPLLTMAAGRNELTAIFQKLLFALKQNGGQMPEKSFHKIALYDMVEREYQEFLKSAVATDQVKMARDASSGLDYVLLPELYAKVVKVGSPAPPPESGPTAAPAPEPAPPATSPEMPA